MPDLMILKPPRDDRLIRLHLSSARTIARDDKTQFLSGRFGSLADSPLSWPSRGERTSRKCAMMPGMSTDDTIVQTPDGPMTWAEWKKKKPVQIPSRRTKGKKLPEKAKRFTP